MDEFNAVPIYRNGFGEITAGFDIPIPDFCRRNSQSTRCLQYYLDLEKAEPGFYVCPYGFCSYVFRIDDDNFIFSCLRVEGKYERKKLIPKIEAEGKAYRELSVESIKCYEEAYKEFFVNQNKYDEYRSFIEDILHDIRKFNADIKYKNDRILRKCESHINKYGEFDQAAKGIQATCWFLSIRLNNHDFIYNEDIMKADRKTSYNMYRIIDKVRMCMREKCNSKNVKVVLNAKNDCRDTQAYDCIELLPYIILDNAIKYSPENYKIEIDISEQGLKQYIEFSSMGPYVEEYEKNRLIEQGYRSDNAKGIVNGMGIGLYTAQKICDLNGIVMNITTGNVVFKKNNINYAKFVVDFTVDL